jgi:UDP:flavonoid glycosyltransferase YjiC (YdhE family)
MTNVVCRNSIVFVAIGSLGDFLPVLLCAIEMRELGCEVSIISYPVFIELATQHGIRLISVSTEAEYQAMIACPEKDSSSKYALHHWTSCAKKSNLEIYSVLSEMIREGDKFYVLGLDICCGAKWACWDYEVPFFKIILSPLELIDTSADEGEDESLALLIDDVNKTERSVRRESVSKEVPITNSVALFPKSMLLGDSNVTNVIVAGFPDKGILNFESRNEIKVYDLVYTSGTAFSSTGKEFNVVENVCEKLNISGLFISDSCFSDLPATSKYLDYAKTANIPLSLKSNSILISHGGVGTISDGFLAGVPQIIIPRAFDQFYHADIIEILGLGASICIDDFSEDSLLESIISLIDKYEVIVGRIDVLGLNVLREGKVGCAITNILQDFELGIGSLRENLVYSDGRYKPNATSAC